MGMDSKRNRSRTKEGDPQLKIRIPEDLKETIEKSAEKNGRSRVAEILYRLRKSLKPGVNQ